MDERRARLVSRWTRVGGLSMHALVSTDPVLADRLPVVLVHGLVVSSRYMVPTAERLAPHHRVYAPDLPGYGRSGKPARVLDVPALADALVGWMRAAGLDRAALVANSFGCQVAADVALRYPEHVERMALLGPTVDPSARNTLVIAARWLLNAPIEPPGLGLVMLRDLWDMGPRRAIGTFRAMLRDRIERKLPGIQAPTLVVRGGLDSTVSQGWCEEAVRLLPRGRLVVIPGAPHTINYNAPREVARIVRAFLAEPRAAGARRAAG